MFAQFRTLYPTGSLISELLAITEGHFVVRALIQIDGITLATGIAAAKTVELAEDQAKRRSLQALGIEIPMASPQPSQVISNSSLDLDLDPDLDLAQEEPAFIAPPELSSYTPVGSDSADGVNTEDWLSETDLSLTSSKARTRAGSPALPELNPEGTGEISPLPLVPETSTTGSTHKQASRSKRTSDEVTDFSSDIAQTDIQLKRLGWTAEQGVSYLQKTYGKRSRRTLTEEELLDFLHYLESLPNPSQGDG
ncbi:MAG: hypothetical protein ACRC8A_00600 [Microcoleaceae cyanobacterium]